MTASQKRIPWATVCLVEGATRTYVPLYENAATIGSAPDATVPLIDPAAGANHCSLTRSKRGGCL